MKLQKLNGINGNIVQYLIINTPNDKNQKEKVLCKECFPLNSLSKNFQINFIMKD